MPTFQPGEAPLWSGEMNYEEKYTGTLYITNRRLIFEHKAGVISRRDVLAAEIPLRDVTSASVEKGPWDWTVLVIVAGGQKYRFLFRVESPDVLIKRISELIAGQKA